MESGGAEKKTVRVTIFNQSYAVRAAGDPSEIQSVAAEIDKLMESIASRSGDTDPSRVAVLVCLHLADRLRTLERQLAELERRVKIRSGDMSSLLDETLGGAG